MPAVLRLPRFDRERSLAFARFLWKRFFDDKCLDTAGALSYTTLFAAVPMITAVFGVIAALPVFGDWRDAISNFLFHNFVPATGKAVQHYLLQFASNASKLTSIGIVVLLFTALMLMFSIEEQFNRIWRVAGRRALWARFLVYWATLTLGPIALVAALGLSSYLSGLPVINHAADLWKFKWILLSLLPFVVTFAALFGLYYVVPNRHVYWHHAAIGALVASILFGIARVAFTAYVATVASYREIYGTLAVVPLFLIWVYLSWVIVLLGASLAASIAAFEYRPHLRSLPPGAEFLGLMHVIKHFAAAQRAGRGLDEDSLRKCASFFSDDLLRRYLDDLQQAGMIRRTEDEEWVLICNLETVSLADLYEAGHYRLPLDAELFKHLCVDLPPPLRQTVDELAGCVRDNLEIPMSRMYPAPGARSGKDRPSSSSAENAT